MTLRVFGSASPDAARNLAMEELLLETLPEDSVFLFFYRNGPCVVIGRNQDPRFELSPGAGLPCFRRVSGGGAVYHDLGNLNWSLILPRSLHDPRAELELVAGSLGEALPPGTRLVVGPRGGLFLAAGDAAVGAEGDAEAKPGDGSSAAPGPKVSGDARRLSAKAVLHHGTLLLDADLFRLEASLAAAPGGPVASVPSPVANLGALRPEILVGEGSGPLGRAERAAGLLARAFARRLLLPPPAMEDPFPPSDPEAAARLEALEARHRSSAWAERGELPASPRPAAEPSRTPDAESLAAPPRVA